MSKLAIQAENLGKLYRLGERGGKFVYKSFREEISNFLSSPFRKEKSSGHLLDENRRSSQYIWALENVSFQVIPGEVVGIIGPNGAGKTTLLKILSRITEPTRGLVHIWGRVRSLLEVGTGFHPELTGRENIYLNGAILGMRKAEIDRKFDEIVSFSEIGDFIETPVKRYSSGMYVRLAFSVAAHLEPDILLVDEVLAVGDASFQKKCLGKMGDVAKGGQTVIFVSHNMVAIENLCPRTMFIQDGHIKRDGNTREVIESYISLVQESFRTSTPVHQLPRKSGFGEKVRIVQCRLCDRDGQPTAVIKTGDRFIVNIDLKAIDQDYDDLFLNIGINTANQIRVATVTTRDGYGFFSCGKDRVVSINATLDDLALSPGHFNITAAVGYRGRGLDQLEYIALFEVVEIADRSPYPRQLPGFTRAKTSWEVIADHP